MNKALDIKTFSTDDFDAKIWINQAYKTADKTEDDEVFVNGTISTLQVYMQQLNHALEETTAQVISGLPRLSREASGAEVGARGLQTRLVRLQGAIEEAQRAAGHPLLTLQKTDRLKTKLELARQSLREADKWAALAGNLEGVLESGEAVDLPTITHLMEDINVCLEVLSGSSDFEDKRLQLDGLRNRFEALLSPTVVEAFTSRQTDKCKQLWYAFGAMGRLSALSVYRARCEDAALRTSLAVEGPRGPTQLRDLHAALLRHATHQLEWSSEACPGESTLPWLLRLHGPLLGGSGGQGHEGQVPSSPEHLLQLLQACDHYNAEMASIINREQGKRGIVTDEDLSEFGRCVYAPVRSGLSSLGSILTAAMLEDLGPMPAVDMNSSEAGTVFQLRVTRASRTLESRLEQGCTISRGAAQHHLVYAAQWLMEELCRGWGGVRELPGSLSLLRAHAHLQQLATHAQDILDRASKDVPSVPKLSSMSPVLQNWGRLLGGGSSPREGAKSDSRVKCDLQRSPEQLHSQLSATAMKLLLQPISSYLEGVELLEGWSDNEQFASELPDFSLSPQEYITQVGQYLLTLPQHLEPLLYRGELLSCEEDPAYNFLNQVCNSACEMLATKISSIKRLDSLGARKCSTDIAYLTSVLEELGAGSVGLLVLTESLSKKTIVVEPSN